MGNKSIRKEVKKPKKSDKKEVNTAVVSRPVTVQPELIKKVKKMK